MRFNIRPNLVNNAAADMKNVDRNLRNVQMEISNISRQINNVSDSYLYISKVLEKKADSLETLISKLSTMEDGIEKAVELYLSCEKKLMGDLPNALKAEENSTKKNSFFENLQDWFQTGIWGNREKADRVRRDKAMAKELKTMMKSDRYSQKNWKKASVEERKQILRDLFNEMQAIYGVSLSLLTIEPIPSDPGYTTNGYYSDFYRGVWINEDLLSDPSHYNKIMNTMVHEMRHAYQHEVVRNPKNFMVDEETVKEWSDNFENYKTTAKDGYSAYRDQPIEKDARQFASWVI